VGILGHYGKDALDASRVLWNLANPENGVLNRNKVILESTNFVFMIIKVDIDQEECSECGLCYNDECPMVFEEDEDGISQIREKYRIGTPGEGAIPSELVECVQSAIEACPTDSIMMYEADETPKDKVVGY
jgi:ferredoxin